MKKITLFFLIFAALQTFASDSTETFKKGFRFHGVQYEFGQDDFNYLDKHILKQPFYSFHEFGLQLQIGADKRQQRLLELDFGLFDNDKLGAGYYAKLDYGLKIKFLKVLYIKPQIGLGTGQFFFHDDILDSEYYDNYDFEDEQARLFYHTGIEGGINLDTFIGIPFEVFVSRQRFSEFWTPFSDDEIFNNTTSTIGVTYTF